VEDNPQNKKNHDVVQFNSPGFLHSLRVYFVVAGMTAEKKGRFGTCPYDLFLMPPP